MWHERVHRIVTGTQGIRATHSRLGFSQIHASSSILHQQVRQQVSSSTTAETGYPVPAGGSRGPQTLSEIPSPPTKVPGKGPLVLALILGFPQNESSESSLDRTQGDLGLLHRGSRQSSLRAVLPVQTLTDERL